MTEKGYSNTKESTAPNMQLTNPTKADITSELKVEIGAEENSLESEENRDNKETTSNTIPNERKKLDLQMQKSSEEAEKIETNDEHTTMIK